MTFQNLRIVSQDDRYNLPYSLINIFIYKTEIYARMINGEEYLLGTYSTEEKAKYIFKQILSWTQNTYVNYYQLPEDEKVDLDNLD